jgi:NitT/TauT family transport system ATP-binding protein
MTTATTRHQARAKSRRTAGLAVAVDGVSASFPAHHGRLVALKGCSLEVAAGSFTVVIGPNGCGKSTLLRLIAGLLAPDSGRVLVGDGDGAAAPRAGDPRVGIAFQQPRLLPWLTTVENAALPLSLHGVSASQRKSRAGAALERVGLGDAGHLHPRELSGGMAQRAGLARALITDPPVLLLDEPFSALDALTREAFDTELQNLWLEQPRTLILVTHSVPEAVRLADQVLVMTARPGSVARLIPVELPRPRDVQIGADSRAADVDVAIRATLASVHPPELTPWTASR